MKKLLSLILGAFTLHMISPVCAMEKQLISSPPAAEGPAHTYLLGSFTYFDLLPRELVELFLTKLLIENNPELATYSWDNAQVTTLAGLGNKAHTGFVFLTIFNEDSSRLTTFLHTNSAKIWKTSDGRCLATLAGRPDQHRTTKFNTRRTRIITHTPDETTAKIWNAEDGSLITTLTGHTKPIIASAFDAKDTKIVTGSEDGTVKIWNAETGVLLVTLNGHTDTVNYVEFDSKGKTALSLSADGSVRVWNVYDGLCNAVLRQDHPICLAQFCLHCNKIITHDKTTAKIWDLETGRCTATIDPGSEIIELTYIPQMYKILIETREFKKIWHLDGTFVEQFSRYLGNKVGTNGKIARITTDNMLQIWDPDKSLTTKMFLDRNAQIAHWDLQLNKIVTITYPKTMKFWDTITGRSTQLHEIPGNGNTASIEFNQAGDKIIFAYPDHTIIVFNTADGSCHACFNCGFPLRAHFNPSGSMILAIPDPIIDTIDHSKIYRRKELDFKACVALMKKKPSEINVLKKE